MADRVYTYIIVGGGLAGASAIRGIRELDREGSILLISAERHLPYDRPPLTKKLWSGQKKVEDIFLLDNKFCADNDVQVELGTNVVTLDAAQKAVITAHGKSYRFGKLLLATGGVPRTLPVPGGDGDGICYYRYLDDYLRVRKAAEEGKTAVVVGGGFIGSEIAAALAMNHVKVTMIFPDPYLCMRVFPESLGFSAQRRYVEKGVNVLARDTAVSFTAGGNRIVTHTASGKRIESDLLIVGVGITPSIELAAKAGLKTENGIVVDEYLQTSSPDIYAAGDNALFPYQALGQKMRVEHWDNALNQGKSAGRNMAGAGEPFTYMPYFFSDLFEFGYEAVGEVDARLEIFADWQKENATGVIYYLKDWKVRGVMLCNVWGKIDDARALIKGAERMSPERLRGAIG